MSTFWQVATQHVKSRHARHGLQQHCHSWRRLLGWSLRRRSSRPRPLGLVRDRRSHRSPAGRNSPRSRAAQREAIVCHVRIDVARGCDNSSIFSVSAPLRWVATARRLWLQQELSSESSRGGPRLLFRRNALGRRPEAIAAENGRGPPLEAVKPTPPGSRFETD